MAKHHLHMTLGSKESIVGIKLGACRLPLISLSAKEFSDLVAFTYETLIAG